MKFFCAVLFVCLLHGAVSQITREGTCPTGIVADESYDNAAAAGDWYIAEQIPWSGTNGITCATISEDYSPTNITITLGGVLEATNERVSGPLPASIEGKGVYSINIMGTDVTTVAISADLEKYVTYYSCMDIGNGQSIEYAWILSKNKELTQENLTEARAALSKVGVSTDDLETMNQNC